MLRRIEEEACGCLNAGTQMDRDRRVTWQHPGYLLPPNSPASGNLPAACSHGWPVNLRVLPLIFAWLWMSWQTEQGILFAEKLSMTIYNLNEVRRSSVCYGWNCWVPSPSPFPGPLTSNSTYFGFNLMKTKLRRPNWSGCFPSCSGPPNGFK